LKPSVAISPSGIREIFDRAWGVPDMLHLEVGEPDFPTPLHIVEAATEAAHTGSGYTNTSGLPSVRDAVVERLRRVHSLDIPFERVLISNGGVNGLNAVISAMVSDGDEVLIPDPGWPNYTMMIAANGARCVRYPLRAANGFVPDAREVESLISDRTRVLIVCSPNNPTGTLIPKDVLSELVDVARKRDVLVLSDEVYDEIVFDGDDVASSLLSIDEDAVAGVWSCSKTYAMTGWRVGYVATPAWLAPSVVGVQEGNISCVSTVTQAAALAALTGPQACVAEMRAAYEKRRDLIVGLLRGAGIDVVVPGGAFYVMLPLADGADGRAGALSLIDRGVAVAPGTAFGDVARDSLRLSLAASEETIAAATERILAWYAETDGGLALE